MIRCGYCGMDFPRDDFIVRDRDRRWLADGRRVISAMHRRCGQETQLARIAIHGGRAPAYTATKP